MIRIEEMSVRFGIDTLQDIKKGRATARPLTRIGNPPRPGLSRPDSMVRQMPAFVPYVVAR
jgi:hypothetical protein